LIIPALATQGLRRGNRLAWGYVVGAVGYLAGIVLSVISDLPTGALIVWMMATVALVAGTILSDKRLIGRN